MISYECLLRGVGRLVSARDPNHGEEIVATARAAGLEQDARARLAELASLVAFALRPTRPSAVWLHGAILAALLVLLAHATPLALVTPFLLLALGVLDARLAAAATLFWLWRLTTADVSAVIEALGDVSLTAQVVRWLLMLVGLAVAVHVTRASIRRAAAL